MAYITKTEGKAQWTREFKFTTTVLTRCKNGKWRVTEKASGWDGGKPGVADVSRFVETEEAVEMLTGMFECTDEELAAYTFLKDYAPADMD